MRLALVSCSPAANTAQQVRAVLVRLQIGTEGQALSAPKQTSPGI